jgi:hypothetical protein
VRRRAALALLPALALPAIAEAETVDATVAGHRYALPRSLLPQDGVPPPPGGFGQAFTLQPRWPGMTPPPPGLSYDDGLLDILLQDLSATTRVEGLAALPNPRRRFLALWRVSTAEQSGLPRETALDRLIPLPATAETAPGLRPLGPPLPELDFFADAPPPEATTLLTYRAGAACQMWWMQDETAVQVTFAGHLRAEWAAVRDETVRLLRGLRVR